MVSLVRNGGFLNVFLIAHHKLTNVPRGVVVIIAKSYMPFVRIFRLC